MRKIYLFILLAFFCVLGLGCGKKQNIIANIPFDMMDNGAFTLEAVAKDINDPLIVALDKQDLLSTLYKKIRQNGEDEKITMDENNDLVIMVMRGKKGSCNNANMEITKISQEKKKLSVVVTIDNGQSAESKDCAVIMNPYQIVKISKANIKFDKKLKIELVNSANAKVLAGAELNNLPGFLQ